MRELARAAGVARAAARAASRATASSRAAVRETPLRVLGRARRASPGSPTAAGALFAELQRALVTPARFTRALRSWAARRAGRTPRSSAALYSGYHRRLERLGALDEEGFARAALDALRERPGRLGPAPVFLYGFDDLTPLQLDAVETLSGARRGRRLRRAALRGGPRRVRGPRGDRSSC